MTNTAMIEPLLLPAREQLEKALSGHPIPKERNLSEMARVIAESTLQALTAQLVKGDIRGLVEMLSGRETVATTQEVQNLLPQVAGTLAQRLGVPKSTARSIALFSIPVLFNMLNTRVVRARQNGMDPEALLCGLKGASVSSQPAGQADLISRLLDHLMKQ